MRILLCFSLLALIACTKAPQKTVSEAQRIIDAAIDAHGGQNYRNVNYSFDFRGTDYTFKRSEGAFVYTLSQQKDGKHIEATLTNDGYARSVDGSVLQLSEKDITRYSNSLNSVIYFALLPHGLNDPAVRKTHLGKTTIKGQPYDAVEVRFNEAGGGTDHDDVFIYWINVQTKTMDYLAYLYHTGEGGVRFRRAYNPRTVDGIRFQDYENYKVDKDTPLEQLPALYEAGKLKLLSKIDLEKIQSL